MKTFLLTVLSILIAASIVAWKWQPPPPEAGKIPLVWATDNNPARQEQIKLFKRMYPKYELRIDPSNYSIEKIIVQSQAGVGPDCFDSFGAFMLSLYVKSGIAWDVTDELKKMGIDAENMVWDVSKDSFIYKGRIYGFPTNAGVRVLLYNKDIFDKAGIPYPKGPWKWTKDFLPLARKLTIRDKKGRTIQFGILSPWGYWEQFVRQWGGRVFSEDGTRCVLDSPEAIAAIQFLHDLVYKYKVAPSPAQEAAIPTTGGWGSGNISFFGGQKAAMTIGDRWWLCSLRKYEKLRMGATECPHEKVRIFLGGSRVTLINAHSPRRREALKFLAFLASKPYNDLINHQADWLAPVKKYCFTPEYMHDPDFPQEDYNDVWRDAMNYGGTSQVSPFVNVISAWRIIYNQINLVQNNQKSAEEAMRTAARQVNEEIIKTVKRNPELLKEYERITGRKLN